MHAIVLPLTAGVLGLFCVVLGTQSERLGRVARRPAGSDSVLVARGLAGVSGLLGLALVAVWILS